MTDDILNEISTRMDQLVLLAAANAVRGLKPNEAIVTLGEIGLDRNLIARVVGTTPATVSVRLSEARARKAPTSKNSSARKAR